MYCIIANTDTGRSVWIQYYLNKGVISHTKDFYEVKNHPDKHLWLLSLSKARYFLSYLRSQSNWSFIEEYKMVKVDPNKGPL